jgi:hypothetical protein
MFGSILSQLHRNGLGLCQRVPRPIFRALLVLFGLALFMAFSSEHIFSNAHAQSSPMTKVIVRVTRVESHGKVDNGNNQADLYGEVFFGNRKIKYTAPDNQDFVNVDWRFEGPTDNSWRKDIRVTLRDHDPKSSDEYIDIAPISGQAELLLKVYPFVWGGSNCGLVTNESFAIERSSSGGERGYNATGTWRQFSNGSQLCSIENLQSVGDGYDRHRGYIKYSIYVVRF